MSAPALSGNLKAQAGFLLPILFLLILSYLQPFTDLFSGVLKPIVLGILSLFQFETADLGSSIQVGELLIGWSRDCTGINQFLLLLAMVIWMRRRNLWLRSTLYACLLTIPAALLANIARVLTLIAYRICFYPEVESPELHYFIGFFWILPLVCLFLPPQERRQLRRWIEFAHAMAVLALLAPLLSASEGLAMGVATALLLSKSQVPGVWTRQRMGLIAIWILLGFGIASVRMESFWLPWLLICPLTAKREWLRQPRAMLLLLSSHTLFDLLPGGEWIIWAVAGWTLWVDFIKGSPPRTASADHPARPQISANRWWVRISLGFSLLMLIAPFTAALFIPVHLTLPEPPKNARLQIVPGQGFEIRLPEADPAIGIFWYPPKNYDRHHSLNICMKYGGVTLKRAAENPKIWQSADLYYREFFLLKDQLIESHTDYVLATLGAWASPGIHLVIAVRQSDMDLASFETASQQIADRLQRDPR